MKINLKKEKLVLIDKAFEVLIESYRNNIPRPSSAFKTVQEVLEECFGDHFELYIIDEPRSEKYFVMSVFPESSTVTKIVEALSNNKSESVIKSLWEKNNTWLIEIDARIFTDTQMMLTAREVTSILLHEVGHITASNAITTRLNTIMRYELAMASYNCRELVNKSIFSKLMSLPIFNSCVADNKKTRDSIKEEIRADKFAKAMGYQKELLSVLQKFQKSNKYPNGATKSEELQASTKFAIDTINQFKNRQDNLVKSNLFMLRESCSSDVIRGIIDDVCNELFIEGTTFTESEHLDSIRELYNKSIVEQYAKEFFNIGRKEMQKITQNEIDYTMAKVNSIKSEDDKMMLITYANSKLDLIEYYLDILADPKLSKKYNIPHTASQLKTWQSQLTKCKADIFNYKIPDITRGFIIKYPQGYES